MNPPLPSRGRGLTALLVVGLVLATFATYLPVRGHEFVNYDDSIYVTDNAAVAEGLTPGSVVWAFTSVHSANWHPLTWLSHMLDVQLFGLEPGGHHLTSVVLHALNAVLLLVFLAAATGRPWPSAIAAGLFALHPLRVESVAWIAERKDVLSGTFFFLTLLAYLRWVRRPGTGAYVLVATLLALGLMAKQMLVTLPGVLLLMDVWPLRRCCPTGGAPGIPFKALVREKLPLFGVVAVAAAVSLVAQRAGGAVSSLDTLPLGTRLLNAVAATGEYLRLGLWPSGLASFYPHPVVVARDPWSALYLPALVTAVALAIISALVLRRIRTAPHLVVGWLWYLGMLVPVIGIVQIGSQSHADRYTYLPWIGIAIALTFAADEAVRTRPRLQRPLVAASLLVLGLCAGLSWRQARTWRDSESVARRALEVTVGNWIAHNNLGLAQGDLGDDVSAEKSYRAALAINPRMHEARYNLGMVLERTARPEEARKEYERLLRESPNDPFALRRLSALDEQAGDLGTAIEGLRSALRTDETDVDGWVRLALLHVENDDPDAADVAIRRARDLDPEDVRVLLVQGRVANELDDPAQALACYETAVKLAPDDARANGRLGRILARAGRLEDARRYLERAATLDFDACEPRVDLARLHLIAGEASAARRWLEEALGIDPDHAEVNDTLGFLLLQEDRLDEAEACFVRSLAADPGNGAVHNNLGYVYELKKDQRGAAEQYRLALAEDIESETAPATARGLAWILATTQDGQLRDGAEAVRWASFALDAGASEDPGTWEILAAARAAAGSFPEAIEAQQRAIELAAGTPREPILRERINRYEARSALFLSP